MIHEDTREYEDLFFMTDEDEEAEGEDDDERYDGLF